jgi:Protein of unknown function (DUF4232)
MHVRKIVFAGSTLALLAALTACRGDLSAAPSSSAVVQDSVSSIPAPAGTSTTAASEPKAGEAAAAGSGKAAASSLKVDMTTQKQGLGLLTLTNTGRDTVTVNGWPKLTFLNAANEELSVPVRQVDVPGPASAINLKPGQSAFAGMKWTDGDKGSASTYVATTLKVGVSGAAAPVPVSVTGENGQPAGYYEFDVTSVQVGTLQPFRQGVLTF